MSINGHKFKSWAKKKSGDIKEYFEKREERQEEAREKLLKRLKRAAEIAKKEKEIEGYKKVVREKRYGKYVRAGKSVGSALARGRKALKKEYKGGGYSYKRAPKSIPGKPTRVVYIQVPATRVPKVKAVRRRTRKKRRKSRRPPTIEQMMARSMKGSMFKF